ncbi:MAG: CBS domain-containing protein, partial [Raoultibacter sp.]
GDTVAHEIMTPRADMILVEDTETVKQAIDRMRGTGYSRLPVYHEDYDRIVGVVKYKDLVAPLMDNREDEEVAPFVSEAFFVP